MHAIPSFISDAVQSWTGRYFVAPGGSDVETFTLELPIVPWGYTISANKLDILVKAVRLRAIRMWCNYRPDLGIGGNTINLTFVDRRSVRPIEFSATASFSSNAYISKKFSKEETLGWYYLTTLAEQNPEITFQMPKGALLELDFSYILHDGQAPIQQTTIGLAQERVYANSLASNITAVGRTNQTIITGV